MLKDALLFAYCLDGKGSGKKISIQDIKKNIDKGNCLWLHFNRASPDVFDWLTDNEYCNEWVTESLTKEEVRTRTIINNDNLYTCLRSINLNEQQEEEDMISIRIFIQNNLIITTRKRELGIIKDICKAIENNEGPKFSIEVLTFLLEGIDRVISEHIDQITDCIDEVEQDYISSISEIKRDDISNIRRKVLLLKRHLSPQKEALKTLCTSKTLFLKAQQPTFNESLDISMRFIEELDLARERCALLQDKMNHKISEQINHRMYIFSMITAVFLPISSIASLFGMNLGGIPGNNNSWAFSCVCFLLIVTSTLLIIFFKKKKWF